MKLPSPAALAAAIVLGAGLSPALAQTAPQPVPQPQTAAPADVQTTTPVVRPAGSRGDCAWKRKNLTS